MSVQLDHVAINSEKIEEMVEFFTNVFQMTVSRKAGARPHRQVWFDQGIQINESVDIHRGNSLYHHIALRVDDKDSIIESAKIHGCSLVEGKNGWLLTGDGIVIELLV